MANTTNKGAGKSQLPYEYKSEYLKNYRAKQNGQEIVPSNNGYEYKSSYLQQYREKQKQQANEQMLPEMVEAESPRRATLKDLTVGSLSRGYKDTKYGDVHYNEIMSGREKAKAQRLKEQLDSDKYNFEAQSGLGKAISGASQLVGQQAYLLGNKKSLAAAGAAAGLAAGVGAAVPLPEEVVTIPVAVGKGLAAGSAVTMHQVEAANAYDEMVAAGVSDKDAKIVANLIGLGVGALEAIQADKLAKSVNLLKGIKGEASQKAATRLAEALSKKQVAKAAGKIAGATAFQTAQEVAQEGVNIAGQNIARKNANVDTISGEEAGQRLKDTAIQSALSFGLMEGVGAVGGAMMNRNNIKAQGNEANAEESDADSATNVRKKDAADINVVTTNKTEKRLTSAENSNETAENGLYKPENKVLSVQPEIATETAVADDATTLSKKGITLENGQSLPAPKRYGKEGRKAVKTIANATPQKLIEAEQMYRAGQLGQEKPEFKTLSKNESTAMFMAGMADGKTSRTAYEQRQFSPNIKAGLIVETAQHVPEADRQTYNKIGLALGVRIRFAEAKELKGNNAKYDTKTNEIVISKDTEFGTKVALAHEIVHELRIASPKEYEALAKAVMEYEQRIGVADRDVAAHARTYEADKGKIDYYDMLEETVADFVAKYADSDSFAEMLAKEPTLRDKVVQIIKDIIRKLQKMVVDKDTRKLINEWENVLKQLENAVKATEQKVKAEASDKQKTSDNQETKTERFSLKNPVEQTKDLIAVQNLNEEKLASALKLGGLPSPSIAIVKAKDGHETFGDITMVFDKATIDPKNKKNKVYGSDAWTPTKPEINYEVNIKNAIKFDNYIWDLSQGVLDGVFKRSSAIGSRINSDSTSNNYEELVEKIMDDEAVKAAYVAEKGLDIKPEYKTKQYHKYGNEVLNYFKEKLGAQKVAEYSVKVLTNDFTEKDESKIRQLLVDYWLKETPGEKYVKAWTLRANKLSKVNIEDLVLAAEVFIEADGGAKTNEIDRWATLDKLNEVIKDNKTDYKNWVKEKTAGVVGEAGIYNGKDPYTASGNKKRFWQLRNVVTLENLVKAMNSEADRGVGMFGGGAKALQATATPKYSSIDEIKADKNRLKKLTTEEHEAILENLDKRIDDIVRDIQTYNNDESYISESIINDVLVIAAQTTKTPAAISKTFKNESNYTVSNEIAKKIANIYNDVAQIPVSYFEAKPQRAVGFEEVKALLIPENTDAALKQQLIEKGMPIVEYDGTEQDRLAKLNSLENVRFSKKTDAKYLELAQNIEANKAELQKMVDEAAKNAGYTIKAYHGTPNGTFTVFKDWQYFTEAPNYADVYQNQGASSNRYKTTANAPRTYSVYLKTDKAFDTRNSKEEKIFNNEFYRKWGNGAPLSQKGLPDWTDADDLIEFFDENGYDYDTIYIDEGGTGGYGDDVKDRGVSIVIKDSAQIKSADPVTYDDNGDIIPLSKRFNEDNKDIRYSYALDEKERAEYNKRWKYNEEDYNLRGWAVVNEGLLPVRLYRAYLKAIKNIKLGDKRLINDTTTGEYLIQLGKDWVVYSDGDFADATIKALYKFYNSKEKDIFWRLLKNARKHGIELDKEIVEYYRRHGFATRYRAEDFAKNYGIWYSKRNGNGAKGSQNSNFQQNGSGNFGKNISSVGYKTENIEDYYNDKTGKYEFTAENGKTYTFTKLKDGYQLDGADYYNKSIKALIENTNRDGGIRNIVKYPEYRYSKKSEPIIPDGYKERGFNESVHTKSDYDAIVQQEFIDNPEIYKQLANKVTKEKAKAIMDKGLAFAETEFPKLLERMDATAIALGDLMAREYSNMGEYDKAVTVIRDMAKQLTKAGQFSQAAVIALTKSNPMTALAYAKRDIDKLNTDGHKTFGKKWKDFELTADEEAMFKNIKQGDADAIKAAYEKINKRIAKEYPSTIWQKFIEASRISMLLNPRTNAKNIASNMLLRPITRTSGIVSAGIQKAYKYFNNDYTPTQAVTVRKETKKLAEDIWNNIKDTLETTNKYNEGIKANKRDIVVFKEGVGTRVMENIAPGTLHKLNQLMDTEDAGLMETLRHATYWFLEMGDNRYVRKNFLDRLGSYLEAQGIREITEANQETIDTAVQVAYREAMRATFKDDTALSKWMASIKHTGNPYIDAMMEMIMPFTKTPANIAMRGIDYSPIGLLNTLNKYSKNKDFNELADELGKNLLGSALIAFGAWWFSKGLVTGGEPENEKEAAFLKQQGWQPYAVKVGDSYTTYDWAQPAAIPIIMGVTIMESLEEGRLGVVDAVKNAGVASFNQWVELSPLQSLKEVMGGYGTVGENLLNTAIEMPQRLIPSALGATARTADTTQRLTYSKGNVAQTQKDLAKSKVPGLSQTLPAAYDTWGNVKKRDNNTGIAAINQFINPASYKRSNATEVDREIERLYKELGDSAIYPRKASYSIEKGGKTYTLSNAEYSEYQRIMGELSYDGVKALMAKPSYSSLSDVEKLEIIKDIYDNAFEKAKYTIMEGQGYKKTEEDIRTAKETKIKQAYLEATPENVAEYYIAYYILNNADSDKTANGTTIAGSKKKNGINRLVELGFTRGEAKRLYDRLKG